MTHAMAVPQARLFAHEIIRASAGTGKTFQLSNRFIGLVCAGEPADQILAATFARKAAREIVDRVLFRLAEAALDDSKLSELALHVAGAPDRDGCLALVKQLVDRLHRLRIGTLDSLFMQMAGSHSLELGLPAGWRVVDESIEERLRVQAIQSILREDSAGELLTLMRLLSKGEITRSVTDQIAEVVRDLYLLYQDTEPAAWQAVPEPAKLGQDALGDALTCLADFGGTFDDRRFADAHASDLAQARREDWLGFVSNGLAAGMLNNGGMYSKKPIEPAVQEAYQPVIEHARAVLIGQLAGQTQATWRLLDKFDAVYRRLKFRERAVRFDDVCRILRDGLSNGRIGDVSYRLDAQAAHLLLDEFQDTSLSQWSVLRPLAELVTAKGSGRSLFCVGDVKQAIYGWRGGVSEIFEAVCDEFDGLTHRSLTQSFRSSQVVIDTVNSVFGSLAGNPAMEACPEVAGLWSDRFQPHSTAKTGLAGHVRLLVAPVGQPEQQRSATFAFAADEVARLAAQHAGRSVGVLVRKNSAVAHLIYELRARRNVPASEEGGNPLTDSPAVQLVMSLLRLADHPGDTVARFHVARSPLGGIVGLDRHDDDPLAERVSLDVRQRLLADGYARTVQGLVERLADWCDQRELNRLVQLVDLCHAYQEQATGRADDFIDYVSSRRVEEPAPAQIRVMTIHQAKGLEFDIVVLPELDVNLKGQVPRVVVERARPTAPVTRLCRYANKWVQRLLPDDWRKLFDEWPRQAVNESLCLLYVSLTRAVHSLVMIIPPKTNGKTWPKTMAGALHAALAPDRTADAEAILYERGDSKWSAGDAADGEPTIERPAVEIHTAGPIRLAEAGTRRRGLERQSPSSMQGGKRVDLARRLRLDSRATTRGSLVHAWFECVEWLDDGGPTDAVLMATARKLVTADLDLAAELAQFRRALELPAVRQALSRDPGWRGGAARFDKLGFEPHVCGELAGRPLECEVQRECPFVVRDGDVLLQGAIDRLVLFNDGQRIVAAHLIDFKTDQVSAAGAIEEKLEYYRPQIEAYCRAAEKLTDLDRAHISACLLFVGAGIARTVAQ
ncbi:MAG: UvrD-helicase domain-containing protein [Pirellulales bacterium]